MKGSVERELPFDAAESKTLHMRGNSMRENRETPAAPAPDGGADRSGKAKTSEPDMHVAGESDVLVVPTKRANKVTTRGGGGVRGGKEHDQGERTTDGLIPDSEPGLRVIRTVAHTTGGTAGCSLHTQGRSRMR